MNPMCTPMCFVFAVLLQTTIKPFSLVNWIYKDQISKGKLAINDGYGILLMRKSQNVMVNGVSTLKWGIVVALAYAPCNNWKVNIKVSG
jgi:hypothetical protein